MATRGSKLSTVLHQYDLVLMHPGHGHNETGFSPHRDTLKKLDDEYRLVPTKDAAGSLDPGETILAIEAQREGTAALTALRQQFVDAGWSEHAAEQMVIAMLMKAPQ